MCRSYEHICSEPLLRREAALFGFRDDQPRSVGESDGGGRHHREGRFARQARQPHQRTHEPREKLEGAGLTQEFHEDHEGHDDDGHLDEEVAVLRQAHREEIPPGGGGLGGRSEGGLGGFGPRAPVGDEQEEDERGKEAGEEPDGEHGQHAVARLPLHGALDGEVVTVEAEDGQHGHLLDGEGEVGGYRDGGVEAQRGRGGESEGRVPGKIEQAHHRLEDSLEDGKDAQRLESGHEDHNGNHDLEQLVEAVLSPVREPSVSDSRVV